MSAEDASPGSDDDGATASSLRDRLPPFRGEGSDRWATWLFTAYLVVAAPLILFHFGTWHWFFRDDFVFLADRRDVTGDLFATYGGAHWVALPRLAYLVVWKLFGMGSYVPYQAMVVALHLTACALLRLVMRRAGVGNWLASAAAATLVLFGPGSQNILWAFQISFVGSLTYGLAQLLLADHEGKVDWRDGLAIAFGLAGLMSSGVGITMTAIVGAAILVRRGWKRALLQVVPLALIWGAWALQAHPNSESPFGPAPIGKLVRWVVDTQQATFAELGHWGVVGVALALVLLAGLALTWLGPNRTEGRLDALRRTAAPLALFGGGLMFATTSGLGRWWAGSEGARSSRYIYLGVALLLPLLAVAAQTLADRWRPFGPAFVVALVLLIPFNLEGFRPGPPFDQPYMDSRREILTTAVRMPFVYDVPGDVQPVPDPYSSDQVTIGFLRNAARIGKLHPSTIELTPEVVNEYRIRLGVAQRPATSFPPPEDCRPVGRSLELSLQRGDRFLLSDSANVFTREGHDPTSPAVQFQPKASGAEFTVELPELDLIVAPTRQSKDLRYCPYPD